MNHTTHGARLKYGGGFYPTEAVQQLLGDIPRSTLEDWTRKGLVPSPVKVGLRRLGWPVDEMDAHIAGLKANARVTSLDL